MRPGRLGRPRRVLLRAALRLRLARAPRSALRDGGRRAEAETRALRRHRRRLASLARRPRRGASGRFFRYLCDRQNRRRRAVPRRRAGSDGVGAFGPRRRRRRRGGVWVEVSIYARRCRSELRRICSPHPLARRRRRGKRLPVQIRSGVWPNRCRRAICRRRRLCGTRSRRRRPAKGRARRPSLRRGLYNLAALHGPRLRTRLRWPTSRTTPSTTRGSPSTLREITSLHSWAPGGLCRGRRCGELGCGSARRLVGGDGIWVVA
mmetsp:Transcript_25672/g.86287  ORF Transcript_25672/g.86287 Transcript_25672/m.86287 type:complete len:263 (-) Transcript_25672:1501-2289(-)